MLQFSDFKLYTSFGPVEFPVYSHAWCKTTTVELTVVGLESARLCVVLLCKVLCGCKVHLHVRIMFLESRAKNSCYCTLRLINFSECNTISLFLGVLAGELRWAHNIVYTCQVYKLGKCNYTTCSCMNLSGVWYMAVWHDNNYGV